MITSKPAQPPALKRPRFLWRGLLIVLPALVMAGFGFVSLRQDRLLVRHQATEQAQLLATELVHDILPAALYLDLRLPDATARSSASQPQIDSILSANREGIIAALTDNAGLAIFPPPPSWPVPELLEVELLDAQLLALWTAARRELFAGDPAEAIEQFEGLIQHGLPERFEALARFHLFDLGIRAGHIDKGMAQLEQIRQRLGSVRTESGLSLRLLAELQWLRLIAPDSGPITQAEVSLTWLCAHAVFEPGPTSEFILEQVRQFSSGTPQARIAQAWKDVWEAHQRARSLVEFLNDTRSNQSAATNSPNTAWVKFENRDYLVLRQPAVDRAWWLAWSEDALRSQVRRALGSIPAELGCDITVGGRSVTVSPPTDPWLASVSATLEGSTGVALTATVWLADPELLYARQRKRTWWFGSLIAVSAGSVLCGAMAAWRGFREQQRLTELKSNFVSSVSHEMRAPIASVRLMAEELVDRGSSDPAKSAEYHGYILQECRRLSALIENVLDFSRHEQGRKQYQFETVDLVPVVDETIHLMRSYAADRKVAIERGLDGVPFDLDLDTAAIQQVLVNLIDNAIKHSPPGATVKVALSYPKLSPEPTADSHAAHNGAPPVRLSVTDQGPGIPEEEQRLIFQRFYRRGTELRRETQGIGLGLAIVQYIAEAHGGAVRVESQVGHGSRFIVEMPVAPRNKS